MQRNTKQPKKDSKARAGDVSEWSLGRTRFAKLTEFKGKWYVDIREFYDAGGEMKPGKKGIMLQLDQWRKLAEAVDEIDAAIKKHV